MQPQGSVARVSEALLCTFCFNVFPEDSSGSHEAQAPTLEFLLQPGLTRARQEPRLLPEWPRSKRPSKITSRGRRGEEVQETCM